MRIPLSIALLALLVISLACDEVPVVDLVGDAGSVAASFTPDQPSPSDGTVSMAEQSRSGDQLTVAVNVTGVDSVYGADFSVFYEPDRVQFFGHAAGSILESGGVSAFYAVDESPGELTVGAARLGGSGVDVTTTLPLIRLTFRALQAGSSPLDFYCLDGCADPGDPTLLDDDDAGPQPILSVHTWAGGTILAN